MNSWTPRPMPLNYDSLENSEGFVSISSNSYGPIREFSKITIANHDDSEAIFNRLDTVSSTIGPADSTAPVEPFETPWVFWVATAGIRAQSGQSDKTPPADGDGSTSTLYPTTTPTRLSVAFADGGLLSIAIQRSATAIQINRYVDEAITEKVNFDGVSPAMFWTGIAGKHDSGDDIACYYLKTASPRTLFMRRLSEEYATEHVVTAGLPVKLASLIEVRATLGTTKLYARDIDGRDLIIETEGSSLGDMDESDMELSLVSGDYFEQAMSETDAADELDPTGVPALEDDQLMSISIAGGQYGANVAEPSGTNPKDKSNLAISLAGGQYSAVA